MNDYQRQLICDALLEAEEMEMRLLESATDAVPEKSEEYTENMTRLLEKMRVPRLGVVPFLRKHAIAVLLALLLAISICACVIYDPFPRLREERAPTHADYYYTGRRGVRMSAFSAPDYVPDDFTLVSSTEKDSVVLMHWEDEDGSIVYHRIPLANCSIALNTEQSDYALVWVNDIEMRYLCELGVRHFMWEDGENCYTFQCPDSFTMAEAQTMLSEIAKA